MNPAGKHVLVTGGAKRIGASLVRAFAHAGASVTIHCFQSADAAEALRTTLPNPEIHRVIRADLRAPDCPRIFDLCAALPDILINNASCYTRADFLHDTPALEAEHFELNYRAPTALMKEFFRRSDLRDGVILNLLDFAVGSLPSDAWSYLHSKTLLADATRAAALAFAPQIRVNGLAPGHLLPPDELAHLGMRKSLTDIPLGRAPTLQDLTDAALFLVRNESITGEILRIDCGQLLR